MSQGILVSKKNIGDDAKDNTYDTRKSRLQVALNHDPPHHDIFTSEGTALVTNAGNSFAAREVLFTIKHKLPYTPKVLVHLFVVSTGLYNVGTFFYGFGAIDDYVTYEVDSSEFRIVHRVDDFFSAGYTSTAPTTGKFRVKYSIFSNPVDNYTDPAKR